ncbi:class I SAM-dependent methyltransferase [Streptomyces hygroscopicus]|uniref:SAM-dependent methyltransferase n=1 Tax=Streptomyces hygroscopicus TaxID=1912 RepID=UPI0033CA8EA9
MDRQSFARPARAAHPIVGPLSDASVAKLLDRALARGDERVLDLGCGEGEWLLRALAGRPGVTAEGVDVVDAGFARAREAAVRMGAGDRLVLHRQDASAYTASAPFDVVLSVGATHAFGGLLPTLAAARAHLAPGGCVIVGEGFWERPPGTATLDVLEAAPDDYDDLATTVDRVVADGWVPVHGHVSTPEEWNDFEWAWSGATAQWALDHPEDPVSADVLEAAAEHRTGWLNGYRGTLGFVTLVLRQSP